MHRTPAALALIAVATVAACAPKDTSKPDSTAKPTQAGAPTPAANRGSFDPATHTATIYAKDFAFEAPDSISGGWTTFHLVNDGSTLHHVQLVRLDSGKTVEDLGAAMKNPGPPPRWAVFVGGPNTPNPHAESSLMVDVQPGNYAMICLIPVPDGVPHFAKGMIRALKVTAPAGAPAAEPTADVTVTLADYAFDVKGALTPGKHTFKIVNSGPQQHELVFVKPAAGKSAKDVAAWVEKPNGPPPGDALGGVSGIEPGAPVYFTVDLAPGNYAALCFVPDAKDGKPHTAHGMMKDLVVK